RSAFSAQTVDAVMQSTKHTALEIIFLEKVVIKSNQIGFEIESLCMYGSF
ncbi:MAG: hypothetical protein RL018_117, partial [Pseudomonadota bacterium]